MDKLFSRTGLMIGMAVGAAVVVAGPALYRAARPHAKTAVRAGLEGYRAARVVMARAAEEIEDLIAEVAHELDAKATATNGADPAATDAARRA